MDQQSDEPRLGILTLEESDHILRTSLQPVHYQDQRVITFIRSYLMEYKVSIACRDAMISNNRGYELLKQPDIKAAMERLEKKSASGANFQATSLIRKMQEICEANIMDVMNSDGTFKKKDEIPVWLQRCIKKFEAEYTITPILDSNGIKVGEMVTGGFLKVELKDDMKAAELLARDHGIFREVKVTQHELGKNAAKVLLGSAEQRAEQHVMQMREVSPPPAVGQRLISNNMSEMPMLEED